MNEPTTQLSEEAFRYTQVLNLVHEIRGLGSEFRHLARILYGHGHPADAQFALTCATRCDRIANRGSRC